MMLELETRLADMAKQALELVKAMEGIRMVANEASLEEANIEPVERLLLHLLNEEEEAMRAVARNLATWQHLTRNTPESVE
ncbi:hypothetical protein [Aeromonas salmonicida]|uniref:hypothetical protein n=1 Tax=Aeromonas salmonicida TaxID=645 RepID=UPI001E503AEE|nr:hypothetical protein [Aeromonas salmonicida]